MSYVAPPQAQQVYLSSSWWSATFCFFTSSRKKHNDKFLKIPNLVYGSVAPSHDVLHLRWIEGHKIDGKSPNFAIDLQRAAVPNKRQVPKKNLIMVLSFEIRKV